MNDRLRFRAWVVGHYFSENDEEKEVLLKLHDVAVYNDGLIGIDYHSLVADVNKILTNESERESLLENVGCQNLATGDDWYYFEAKFIEQCTGLKDKKYWLIYEGDIVKYTRTNWYCPGHPKHNQDLIDINEIFWDDEEYSFRRRGKFPGGNGSGWIGSIKFNDSRADENIIEVIGNIHENPELLEDK